MPRAHPSQKPGSATETREEEEQREQAITCLLPCARIPKEIPLTPDWALRYPTSLL